MNKNSKIYVAGNSGLVGSAIERNLRNKSYSNFVFTPHSDFDLTNQKTVKDFFEKEKPEIVFLAAAKVGGILANNKYRAKFIYENLQIQNNIIHQSFENGVKKLIFLGSSCIYPKKSLQPIKEEYLLTSELEYTNEPYAVAKIAGIKMCENYNLEYGTNFMSVMPTNLYGLNDNYNLEESHVLPALLRKMHLGKVLMNNDFDSIIIDLKKNPIEGINYYTGKDEIISLLKKFGIERGKIKLWGTGNPRREFLHADDLADACVFLAENKNFKDLITNTPNFEQGSLNRIKNTHVNIGTGKDISIKELAYFIKDKIVYYEGNIEWDSEKPDGTFQKLLDTSKINALGWKYKIELEDGIKNMYDEYLK